MYHLRVELAETISNVRVRLHHRITVTHVRHPSSSTFGIDPGHRDAKVVGDIVGSQEARRHL
jgi:hypothetical protein